jgi:hypothetical protein
VAVRVDCPRLFGVVEHQDAVVYQQIQGFLGAS